MAFYCNICDKPLFSDSGDNLENKYELQERNDIETSVNKAVEIHRSLSYFYAFLIVVAGAVIFISGMKNPVVYLVVLLPLMLAIVHFKVSKGLLKRAGWAKGASIGLGFLLLFGFPIGTFIGINLLFCMRHKDWQSY